MSDTEVITLRGIQNHLETGCQFHQPSTSSFYVPRSQKRKKILMTSLYFLHFWDLRAQKMLIKSTPRIVVLKPGS